MQSIAKHKGREKVQQLRISMQFWSKLLQYNMAVASLSDEGFERVAAEPRKGEYPACSWASHGVVQLGSAGKRGPHPILVSLLTSVLGFREVCDPFQGRVPFFH